jgi:hypothetical protein
MGSLPQLAGVRIDSCVRPKSSQSNSEGESRTAAADDDDTLSVRCNNPRYTNTPSAAKARTTNWNWET